MNTFLAILKSLGAVVAGYVVIAVLTIVTISTLAVLFPASYQPENTGWVILNVIYGCLFAAVGGYLTARLAPTRPLWHVLALGIFMALFSGLTAWAVASAPADSEYARQPGWYYPALTLLAIPCVLMGYAVYVRTIKQLKTPLNA